MASLRPPLLPMEALSRDVIPVGKEWSYEPKWDGFRCIAFRAKSEVTLQSKSGQDLTRYFPEIAALLLNNKATTFVVDGELLVLRDGHPSFDDLLQRIHPAASRVKKLATEWPATYVLFDLLVDEQGRNVIEQSQRLRRRALTTLYRRRFADCSQLVLSPHTTELKTARGWLRKAGGAVDGVIAKNLEARYESGLRSGVMQKIKKMRTADCVVGGFRYATGSKQIGSLLLGLYDSGGLLHHVGFSSSFARAERAKLKAIVEPLIEAPGFTGNAPGGPSRWSTERSSEWQPLRPSLVVEVQYDHVSGGRFRHGTKFLRWRPDKSPRQCTLSQIK